jgi:hypothetical protein
MMNGKWLQSPPMAIFYIYFIMENNGSKANSYDDLSITAQS